MLDKNFIIRKINLIQEELEHLLPLKDIAFDESYVYIARYIDTFYRICI